jgi:hypothetical protein
MISIWIMWQMRPLTMRFMPLCKCHEGHTQHYYVTRSCHDVHVTIIRNVVTKSLDREVTTIITTSGGGFNCINHHHVTGWLKRCLLGFQRSRYRSVNQERDLLIRVTEDTLGPLGEIHPMLQYVTTSRGCDIMGTSLIAMSVTRLN